MYWRIYLYQYDRNFSLTDDFFKYSLINLFESDCKLDQSLLEQNICQKKAIHMSLLKKH